MKILWIAAALLLSTQVMAQNVGQNQEPRRPAPGGQPPGGRMEAIDTDKDGKISREEAKKGAPRLAERFDELDKDKDGFLVREELMGGMRGGGERMREGAREAFAKADADGDGKLSKAEAEKGLPRVAASFDKMDANSDGYLTQEEMRAFMRSQRSGRQPPPRQ